MQSDRLDELSTLSLLNLYEHTLVTYLEKKKQKQFILTDSRQKAINQI